MSQLYLVTFVSNQATEIETGKIIIVAKDQDEATMAVGAVFGLPVSQTRYEVQRVKPSLYQVSRSRRKKGKVSPKLVDVVPTEDVVIAHKNEPNYQFSLSCYVEVSASSEERAWMLVSSAIAQRAHDNRKELHGPVRSLEMTVEKIDTAGAMTRMEMQALYKEHRIFSGGAARPR